MYCDKCGHQAKDNANYCIHCGKQLLTVDDVRDRATGSTSQKTQTEVFTPEINSDETKKKVKTVGSKIMSFVGFLIVLAIFRGVGKSIGTRQKIC